MEPVEFVPDGSQRIILLMRIPDEATEYVRSVFARANAAATNTLTRHPNTWEEHLDQTFIGSITQEAGPVLVDGNTLVTIETHFLGSRRFFGHWEVADIGLVVAFRTHGLLTRSKVALLQSKRLYPNEVTHIDEMGPGHFTEGFVRLVPEQAAYATMVSSRQFSFTWQSRYRALQRGSEQEAIIRHFRDANPVPVHYLLYNPVALPLDAQVPALPGPRPQRNKLGARVVPGGSVELALSRLGKNQSPSARRIARTIGGRKFDNLGLRVEDYVADRLLGCSDGHLYDGGPPDDPALYNVFYERSHPITASIGITIDTMAE